MSEQFLCSDCGCDIRNPDDHYCQKCREVREAINGNKSVSVVLIDEHILHNGQEVLRQWGLMVPLERDE